MSEKIIALLVQLFVIFFGLPRVGIVMEPFPAAVLVFAVNTGAYDAETVRAALESVPRGQLEAGQCTGLSYWQTMRSKRSWNALTILPIR